MPDGRVTSRTGKARAPAKRPRTRRTSTPPLRSAPPAGSEHQPHLFHLIARDTADQVVRLGVERAWFGDLYHRILTMGWWSFFAAGAGINVVANFVFAALYLLQPGSILNARPGAPTDAFFFSVQTMATIGYGVMSPATFYANLLMTLETAVGLMFVALTTGIVFARFSRPTARVLFSNVAVWFQRATSIGLSREKVCARTGCRTDKLSTSAVNARANGRILLVLIFMILLASEVDSCQSGADGGNA